MKNKTREALEELLFSYNDADIEFPPKGAEESAWRDYNKKINRINNAINKAYEVLAAERDPSPPISEHCHTPTMGQALVVRGAEQEPAFDLLPAVTKAVTRWRGVIGKALEGMDDSLKDGEWHTLHLETHITADSKNYRIGLSRAYVVKDHTFDGW